jgi:hypothetical protein
MSPIAAKVTSIEKGGDQYQVIVQISPKYRGSFNTLLPNEDPTYPNIFFDMVFLGSTGHLAKPRNAHRPR